MAQHTTHSEAGDWLPPHGMMGNNLTTVEALEQVSAWKRRVHLYQDPKEGSCIICIDTHIHRHTQILTQTLMIMRIQTHTYNEYTYAFTQTALTSQLI